MRCSVLTPKYQSVLYIDVRVVRDTGWASSAASIGAELEAMVIPRPIRNREAIYMAATHELAVFIHTEMLQYGNVLLMLAVWMTVERMTMMSPTAIAQRLP